MEITASNEMNNQSSSFLGSGNEVDVSENVSYNSIQENPIDSIKYFSDNKLFNILKDNDLDEIKKVKICLNDIRHFYTYFFNSHDIDSLTEYTFKNKIEVKSYKNWIAKIICRKSLTYNLYTAQENLKKALSPKDNAEIYSINVERKSSFI